MVPQDCLPLAAAVHLHLPAAALLSCMQPARCKSAAPHVYRHDCGHRNCNVLLLLWNDHDLPEVRNEYVIAIQQHQLISKADVSVGVTAGALLSRQPYAAVLPPPPAGHSNSSSSTHTSSPPP